MEDNFFNVAVYIDYENVYKILLAQHKNLLREGFFEKFRNWCKSNNRRIVKIAAYCNFDNEDLYNSYHQTRLQMYGIDTIHTSNKGKNFADLQIAIDVLNNMYLSNNIDEFIIMSNDKDMTPLLNTIKLNKRKVSLITVGENFDSLITNYPDEHIKIETILNSECDKILIDDLKEEIAENISKYCQKKLEDIDYNHYAVDYNVTNIVKYFKIMKYEAYNIIAMLYESNDIFFYNYDFKGKQILALAPVAIKESLLAKNIITDEKIVKNYRVEDLVNSSYSEFVKK